MEVIEMTTNSLGIFTRIMTESISLFCCDSNFAGNDCCSAVICSLQVALSAVLWPPPFNTTSASLAWTCHRSVFIIPSLLRSCSGHFTASLELDDILGGPTSSDFLHHCSAFLKHIFEKSYFSVNLVQSSQLCGQLHRYLLQSLL